MKKEQSIFAKALNLITYKKTSRPETFVLPETDEKGNMSQNSNSQDKGKGGQDSKTLTQNQDKQNLSGKAGNGADEQRVTGVGLQKRRIPKKPLSPSQVKAAKAAADSEKTDEVKSDYDSNLEAIKQTFHLPENKDLIIREFKIGKKRKAFLCYLDGMADKNIINEYVLSPLLNMPGSVLPEGKSSALDLENIIETNDVKKLKSINKVTAEILKGNTALYVDGLDYILTCESIGFEKRGVETPKSEAIVKGPQEGFSENLRTNISLLRRIIRNKDLVTEFFEIGEQSSTTVAVVYLQNILNPAILNEVRRRLQSIKTDFLLSVGMLEELIEDNPYSIVPTILTTERPDRAAANIMEGRVAIIVDGSPIALIVPVTINALMHSSEDAGLKWYYTTGLRFIRFVAFATAVLLPGFYLALTTFNHEMIPTDLLIAIAKAKENVPFPTIVEVLLMELGFELIREAGVRIPGIIGNTLGIIGALILGEAAVSANIVSPVLIIIVAATGLSNFAIPNYSLAFGVRVLRFYFILAGAFLGFYGLALAAVLLVLMLVNLKSFGIPFLSIVAPRSKKGKDIVIRWPLWLQESRPDFLNPQDRQRQPEITRQWAQEDPNKQVPAPSDSKE
ncbi:MAG TPA: spore germination protein [Peptococcaceae bacterium]|nr:spore germination protein [Peptococcaceae bacterium]